MSARVRKPRGQARKRRRRGSPEEVLPIYEGPEGAVREAKEISASSAPPEKERRVRKKKRRRPETGEGNWGEIVYSRESMNMHDPAERREFVNACLQQMAEAQLEMDQLEYEYRKVTAYLRDLEEIDALPKKQRESVARHAQKILDAGRGREQFYSRDVQMSQNDFERMHEMGSKRQETVDRLAEAEAYQKKIRNDLRRLDNERNAYEYRLDELDRTVSASQILLIFVAVLLGGILVVLFIMSRMFGWNVRYGYLLAALFAALSATVLFFRAQNAGRERKSVNGGITRLILLQNTVKIRYVNNQNLLNYMTLKYNVKNSAELARMVDLYEKEKEDRAKLRGSEKTLMESQRELLQMLRNFHLQYPDMWMNQLSGLVSDKEEVEVRHHLNQQRQSLRERMDYNEKRVMGRAREEIERLARDYPEYADEILDMVARRRI
ncbi:MAG: hypothetical protein K6B72_00145 [Lachnospiraceae bacterium]|nr:hypothetical protein [Lachnospiraceae bacterium]